MPNCDFNKVAKQPYWNRYPVNLLHIFRTLFPKNIYGLFLKDLLTFFETGFTRFPLDFNFVKEKILINIQTYFITAQSTETNGWIL